MNNPNSIRVRVVVVFDFLEPIGNGSFRSYSSSDPGLFRPGRFGLGRFGPISGVARFGPILAGLFGPLYLKYIQMFNFFWLVWIDFMQF